MSCQCIEGSDAIGGCGVAKTRPANPYPLSGLRIQGPDSRDSAAEPGFDVSRHYRSDISSTAGGAHATAEGQSGSVGEGGSG